jgi:hypothetical protein
MPETVNGPEGVSEWDVISWAVHEQNVARLRQRIFTAARDGDWPKVRNLQKMMVRHEALLFPDGGERPRSLRRRSGGVKLEEA